MFVVETVAQHKDRQASFRARSDFRQKYTYFRSHNRLWKMIDLTPVRRVMLVRFPCVHNSQGQKC